VLRGHRTELHAVAVTVDGASVFAGDARGVTVGWDVATPTRALLPVTYEAHGRVTALAVSSDGCWLVCGTDHGEVRRWQVATGTGEMILPPPDDPGQLGPRVNAVAVSPDASRITVVNVDGRLRSWVNGVAAPEVPGRGLNQVWTAAADGTAAMIDDHIWLQVNPAGGTPLHAVTIAPATAVALGPSRQGEPRSLAVAHPGGAVTMFQLTG
jgi:WD40 repeat protein